MPFQGASLSVDGPLPKAPRYTLLKAAELVTDDALPPGAGRPDAERFAGGVAVYPYPCGPTSTFDQCAPTTKGFSALAPAAQIGAFMVYMGSQCTSRTIGGNGAYGDFKRRAMASFEAAESWAVEREFSSGALITTNPNLQQALNGTTGQIAATVLNGGTATSVLNGLALLERAIGNTGRAGMIHVTPKVMTFLDANFLIIPDGPVLRTIQGTIVVPGGGYTGQAPNGSAANTGTQEFMYATGLVAYRRGAPLLLPSTPEELSSIIDRTNNTVRFYVERPYVVVWDQCFLAGVRIDVCLTTVC